MERIPIDEVFKQLKCTNQGLSSQEGVNRLQTFGPNKVTEKKESKILKFLGFMWNPLSWVMEFAALTAIVFANGGGKPPNWHEFVGIICLLMINSTISFIEENKAGNAAASVMASLALKAKVLRDGMWREEEATILVPGDIISIKLGDMIPADARLLEGDPINIDQYALTGESLPVTKNPGDFVFVGSICKQGQIEAVVVATGDHTFFGKTTYLLNSNNQVSHFQKVVTTIANFCICFVVVAMVVEIIVMYPIQRHTYRHAIDSLLVLLIGGIPIAMPTMLFVTMAIGSYKLSQQGAIIKRMTAIGEMASMDVLCSNKTGTLTLNIPSVDRNLIEVFTMDVEKDHVVLLAARASRTDNQDAIDAAIVRMLTDPKEARIGITEVRFLPFNPVDKRTALTYIDSDGTWHRVSKGAPEQILALCNVREDEKKMAHAIIDKFADRGLHSLAVARQEVPEGTNESAGGLWQFVGLLPLFDPLRHGSAEAIQRVLNLGVNIKMITGDQLTIAKEIGRRLGIGTNMYPFTSLLGQDIDADVATLPVEELIEKVDGFAELVPEHKYEIVKKLQERKHVCGMIGNGVNDVPALKKANIGIATPDATDAARSASDIVLTEPGLSVIINAILISRDIFQKMKTYIIYAVSITMGIVFCFMFIALIWNFGFSPFMALIIAILNNGTALTISKDRVKPSPLPDTWKLKEIFTTGVVLGGYLALTTLIFFWAMTKTTFFQDKFGVKGMTVNLYETIEALFPYEIATALFLQISIMSQALIFVARSLSWSYVEYPGLLLVTSFIIAQLIATLIAVYADWGFARIKGVGWGWALVIWLYNIVFYVPLNFMKFVIYYILSGKDWRNMLENKKIYRDQRNKLEQVAKLDCADTEFLTYKMDKFLKDMSREKPIRFTSQHLMLATNNYSNKLGSGGFGSVYKGVFTDGTIVAVKVLYETSNERIEEQFMAEVGTTGRVHHLNLVRLIGFCIEKSMRALVYEYMSNGSLDKYLFHEKRTLGFEKLHEIAIGTAKGIAYLHEECQQRIIHYDIKPQNILLDHNFCPKVADFGLAKLYNREKSHFTMTGLRGTPGYVAPELWMPFPVTYKCDVYSFGMLLFEIIGRRRNLDFNLTESQEWFPKWVWMKFDSKKLEELTTYCDIVDKDKETVERITNVAFWCVQYRPELRPIMSHVAKMLEGLMDIPYPLNPFQHMMDQGQPIYPIDAPLTDTNIDCSSSLEVTKSAIDHSSPITRKHEIEIDMSHSYKKASSS